MPKSSVGAIVWNWLAVREMDTLVDDLNMAGVVVFFSDGALADTVSRV